ncbi:sugar diacid recognition domain-containing protein [Marinobacter salinexigens]|uniref:sugar diacid recognition domain-containing protein n=1 Tax=Marinobacter salinexigens TaxID=2919747 RepID=UPI00165ECAA6|nr:sugar diacid recognition domain-containing protein [Marinobacter salinexigens]
MLLLDQTTAQRIVERTMRAIGYPVNVMNADGVIIASGSPQRVGSLHDAARLVAETGEPLVIDGGQAAEYPGTQPGVNLPVKVGDQLVAVVGISGSPRDVAHFADLVCMTAELMLEQAALLEAGQHRRRQVEETLLALCEGKPVPSVWFEQLGIDVARNRVAVVLEAATQSAADRVLLPLLQALEYRQKAVLAVHPSPCQLLIFLEAESGRTSPDELRQVLNLTPNSDITIAVGQVFSRDFRAGFQSANATLEVGKRKVPEGREFHYDNLRVPALWQSLQPDWQKLELQAPVNKLLNHRQGELYLRTLERFIESNGQVVECSQRLHVHANTVRYRLRRIEAITGLSPFDLPSLLTLQLALDTR